MNVNRANGIVAELTNLARVAVVIQKRYGAHFELHAAAVLNRDTQEMVQRRDELHTILDALLDNGESVQRLQDELSQVTKP